MPDIGKFLWPKSLAVIGASSDMHGLRGRILEIIRSHPFAGRVYPVSRSAPEVQGLKAYPSIEALPETVGSGDPDRAGTNTWWPSWSVADAPASRQRPFSAPALPKKAITARRMQQRDRRDRETL